VGGEAVIEDGERIAAVLDEVEIRLRRVLVARYGVDVGVDLTADVLAWAWENRDRVAGLDRPLGYLYRVAQSQARRYRRWTERAPSFAVVPDAPAAPGDAAGREAQMTLLGLATLTPEQRMAVLLVKAHGWTYPEVAEVLGVPTTTVTNHVTRGLARLRAHLEEAP
jgi:RNA polymerase sigma factor (sigma-70 family)